MYSGKNIFISRLLRPAGRNKRYFHRWGRGGKLYLCAKASPFGRGGCERSEQTERASPAEFYMAAISISDVEQELDHIAIVDNVFLALGALQALGLDSGIIEVVGFQVAIADDAGADEAALKIAVDLTGGLDNLITASYDLLGLISFLTDGKKECRAWTIRKGTKAPQAAGKIHSDFERGFIRAQVIAYKDLEDADFNYAAVKAKGLQRTEGKEYVVKDGDVIEFLFNV